jgi:8-oxo-dGTP pyrophosphatase MutT (NUDIX family)
MAETALRESEEEIGLEAAHVEILEDTGDRRPGRPGSGYIRFWPG